MKKMTFFPVTWILLFKHSWIFKNSTAYARMARSAVPRLFWALWLHHNHKMSISYRNNGLVSGHQPVGRWFIFMCCLVRILWWN